MIADAYFKECGFVPCVMRDGKFIPVAELPGLTVYSTMSVCWTASLRSTESPMCMREALTVGKLI